MVLNFINRSTPVNEESLFIQALQKKNPGDREAFLREACADDDQLKKRVEGLLMAHEAASLFMQKPIVPRNIATAETLPPQAERPSPSHVVGKSSDKVFAGRFKIREKLGEGGMGAVFVADQIEPIQRRVALKVIKGDYSSPALLARFDQERQALALMDHPNIAKVFDAGMAPSNVIGGNGMVPYFVMEMIKGLPITKYCDEVKLSPLERLKLFIPVCQAVQHAHQKGIIHRDLKPSNILVGLYDGHAVPKIIDFGVAKATGSRLTQDSIYTEVGSIVGTLEYMSPEQAEFNNLDIDTRTDIYALGVILYELLTGKVPFSQKALMKTGIFKMLMKIKEEEPAKPSTKLSHSDSLPNVAATRSTEPKKLANLVKGDLDWIVMKALEKDRNRRYETANSFAKDIERFLSNEPVLASPPSALYRFRKYIKRNRVLAGATLLVLLSLIAGIIGTTWGLLQARHQRDLAVAAEKQTLRENNHYEAVNKFLIYDLLAQADPSLRAVGENATVRQLLDQASKNVDKNTSLKDAPYVEQTIRNTLGTIYTNLGRPDLAEPHLIKCLAITRSIMGDDDIKLVEIMHDVAYCLEQQGKYAEAEKLLRESIRIRSAVQSPNHPHTLTSKNNLAEVIRKQGKTSEAEKLHKEVLADRIRTLGEEHIDTMESMNNLGSIFFGRKDYEKARNYFKTAYEVRNRELGEANSLTVTSMANLAVALKRLNRFNEAEPLARKALELDRHTLGPEHPDTLISLNGIATILYAQKKYEEAEKLYRECLLLRKKVLPKDHPSLPGQMIDLADLLMETNRPADAEPFYREGLQGRERLRRPCDYQIQDARRKLGNCLIALKKFAEAEPLLLSAYECLEKDAKASPEEKNQIKDSLFKLYTAWNKPDEAAKWK
ncbi:MAG: tetratricopeptide repeat protein [Gemmatales bacterium]